MSLYSKEVMSTTSLIPQQRNLFILLNKSLIIRRTLLDSECNIDMLVFSLKLVFSVFLYKDENKIWRGKGQKR